MISRSHIKTSVLLLAAFALVAVCQDAAVSEDRPSAPRILPGDALGYVRIDDVAQFRELMKESSIGRMANDPKVKPLMSHVYGGFVDLFNNVSDRVGASLDELLEIPQGEVSFALIPVDPDDAIEAMSSEADDESDEDSNAEDAPKDDSPEAIRARLRAKRREQRIRTRVSFGLVGIVDAKKNIPTVRRIVERGEELMLTGGFLRSTDKVEGVEIVSMKRNNPPAGFSYFIHEGAFIFGSNGKAVKDILLRWKGELEDERLSGNTDFTTVMTHCVGAEDTRPQITFYLNPYQVLKNVTSSGGGGAGLMFVVDSLGLEGIEGIGGSSFLSGDHFESITHTHLLLDSRRQGVLSVLRPKQGAIDPPDWAPSDATSFMAFNWETQKTFDAVRRLYEKFRGDESFQLDVLDKVSERFKVDMEADLIKQLTGRSTMLTWIEPPARLGSEVTLFGVELKDPDASRDTLQKAMKSVPGWKSKVYAGTTIYQGPERELPGEMGEYMRSGRGQLTIVGNNLLFTDSRKLLERAIKTQAGGGPGKLKNIPEFDLIAGELSGQLDGQSPFMFGFSRPEESFRVLYDMLKSPQMRQGLRQLAESNPVAKMFNQALEDNDLPALSVFTQYLAPAGSFAYEDSTGMHLASFGLKKE